MLKSILHTFFIKVLVGVLNLAVIILTSKYLGVSGRGTASLLLTSVATIMILRNIIGGPALVYLAPRYNISELLIPSAVWAFILSFIGAIALHLFHLMDSEYIPHIFVLTVMKSLASNNQMILLGKEKVFLSNMLEFIQSLAIIIIVCICFFVFHIYEVKAYLYGLYIGYALILIVSMIQVSPFLTSFSFKNSLQVLRKMFGYGISLQLAAVFTFLTYRLSYYMIELNNGRAAVGIFSNGVSLTEAILLIGGSISLNLITKVVNSSDQNLSMELTARMARFSTFATCLFLLPLILLPSEFFVKILGHGFEPVHGIILLLSPGVLFLSLNTVLSHYFSGIGRYAVCTYSAAAAFVVMIILNFLLIPVYGIKGAAVASTLAYATMTIYQIIVFKKESGFGFGSLLFSKTDFRFFTEKFKVLLKT